MKIGINDFGIGGLGLYKLLREQTTADLVYFSDSGYHPYGTLSRTELQDRLQKVIDFFHSQDVQHIAVACHAASTVVPEDQNITGIIQHAVNLVVKHKPAIVAVTGGILTINSHLYQSALAEHGIEAVEQIAQPLSIRIEAGEVDSAALADDIHRVFAPISHIRHQLLACTHYPAISPAIQRFLPRALLLDPTEEMSAWIQQHWSPVHGQSQTQWFCTGDSEKMKMAGKKSFGVDILNIEKVTL